MKLYEPLRSLAVELKRRRVMHVVAIYGGVSLALLEGTDLITAGLGVFLGLPGVVARLVVYGFPLAIVIGWMFDMDSGGRLRRTLPLEPGAGRKAHRFGWPARLAITAIGIVLVSASWYTADRILQVEATDPSGSYIVLPIRARAQSFSDRRASAEVAHRLTQQLLGWENVRAINDFALDGQLSRLGISEADSPTLAQAYEMADSLAVGTLIGINAEVGGRSALDGRLPTDVDLQAVRYDVARRREIGRPWLLTGSMEDLNALVEPITLSILELRDQSVSTQELRSESPSVPAHQDFEAGRRALRNWRLEEAEGEFRDAILEDSLFASANHYLAVALYWQTARDPHRILAVGPEIQRYAQAANRLARIRDVRPGRRAHIEAFGAFWRGDYQQARILYREILDKDPSDTEAWVLLGSVEYNDRMLHEWGPGNLVPRQNLNTARRAFETARTLSPDWQISYGHLFDIDLQLASAAMSLICQGFERPGTPRRPPFEQTEADDQANFCAFVEDSIVWVEFSAVDEERRQRAVQDAERLAQLAGNRLRLWVQVHPDQPRPRDELADWIAWRRSSLGCTTDVTTVHQLTTELLLQREKSLSFRADTTREDLVRLALLRLEADDVYGAEELMNRALDGLAEGSVVADEAANYFIARGLPERAIAISRPIWSTWTFSIRDPDGDGSTAISMGDVTRPLMELRMQGATGPTYRIQSAFQDLFAEWSTKGYSPRQAAHVRRSALWQGIGPALALAPEIRASWFDGWEESGLSIPAIWRAFLEVDETIGNRSTAIRGLAADELLDGLVQDEGASLEDHYLTAVLARAVGRHEEAVEHLLRVESCPLNLQILSQAWGLRTLGRWHLSQSYLARADSIRARQALAAYSILRVDGGPAPGVTQRGGTDVASKP